MYIHIYIYIYIYKAAILAIALREQRGVSGTRFSCRFSNFCGMDNESVRQESTAESGWSAVQTSVPIWGFYNFKQKHLNFTPLARYA